MQWIALTCGDDGNKFGSVGALCVIYSRYVRVSGRSILISLLLRHCAEPVGDEVTNVKTDKIDFILMNIGHSIQNNIQSVA